MDRFDALQAFARVVEAGSFTKAAQTLHMSKTTVTQLVQQLEARLRVKLLNRTTRQVKVTPDGAAYYERIIEALNAGGERATPCPVPRAGVPPRASSRGAALLSTPAPPSTRSHRHGGSCLDRLHQCQGLRRPER